MDLVTAAVAVFHPAVIATVISLWLGGAGVASVTLSRLRWQPEGTNPDIQKAWKAALLNLATIGLETVFGALIVLFLREQDALGTVAVGALIVAALAVLPMVLGTYVYGVVLIGRAGYWSRSDPLASRVAAWAWTSVPLTLMLWALSVAAVFFIVLAGWKGFSD